MSNKTVEVPVEALEALKNNVISRTADGHGYELATVLDHTLQSVLAFIPKPLQVGDKIDGEQFAALPPRSVAIDADGDVWVVTNDGGATLVEKKSVYASHDDIVTDDGTLFAADLGYGTLVHIGWAEEEN